jgi:SulP family sulfate permease
VALGLALLLLVVPRRIRHGAAIPALVALAVLAFHGVRLLLGGTVEQGQAAGWLLGPFPSGRMLSFPPAESLALLDWELAGVLLPFAATSALLCAITLALMVTGIEALTARPMNVDREMRLAGYANVAGGALGGLPTAHALSATTLLARDRPVGRWVAAVPAAVALVILLAGADALALVPRPVLAALLLSVGIEWMVIRTWREARLLPRHETAILLVVAASIVLVGIVEGIAIGLGLALLIFAWTYRRVPVIRAMLRGHEMRSSVSRSAAMTRVLDEQGRRIVVMRLQGYMFFLNAETVQKVFAWAARNDARYVVLDFRHVLGMDSAAVEVFARLERDARELGLRLAVAAVPDALDGPFAARGVFLAPGCPRFPSVHQALEHAEELLLLEHGERVDTERASLVALLAAQPGLEDAGPRLEPFVERVAFAPAETLMLQGDPADDMVFIESGRVQAMLLKEGAAPLHLRTLTPGTLVGEIALVRGGTRTATVVAVTPCQAVRIDRDGLARMEAADPALAFAVHRVITLQVAEKLVDNTRAMDLALR